MMYQSLFSPFSSEKLTLDNRIVMAPMTRLFSPNGVPGEDVAAYYRRRVEGGTGLIITEGTAINHPAAISDPNIPKFYGQAAQDGWREVVRQVHEAGGKIFPQLWHVGAARRAEVSEDPSVEAVSPSGLFAPDKPVGRAFSEGELAELISIYGDGAEDAKAMGFDGIELHFAHGYLLDQFFWAPTNGRKDIYGQNPVLLAAEIVAECRRRVGPDFPICLRFSQWKQQDYEARLFETPQQLEAFLRPLVDAGVDIFHCSSRRFWEPEFEGSHLNLAGWTRKLSGKTVITVGSVGLGLEFLMSRTGSQAANDQSRMDELEAIIARQEVDLVAIGRALLVDSQWPAKISSGRFDELLPYSKQSELVLS